jgi:hypothetical protein
MPFRTTTPRLATNSACVTLICRLGGCVFHRRTTPPWCRSRALSRFRPFRLSRFSLRVIRVFRGPLLHPLTASKNFENSPPAGSQMDQRCPFRIVQSRSLSEFFLDRWTIATRIPAHNARIIAFPTSGRIFASHLLASTCRYALPSTEFFRDARITPGPLTPDSQPLLLPTNDQPLSLKTPPAASAFPKNSPNPPVNLTRGEYEWLPRPSSKSRSPLANRQIH